MILFTATIIPTSEAKAVAVVQLSAPVAGGKDHSIALKNNGTIWAWGSNRKLQVGQPGDVKTQPIPKQVELEGEPMFTSVAAGNDFSLALRHDGRVYVLGEGGRTPCYEMTSLTDILAIAAGQTDGLALDRDGTVWQWTIGNVPRKVPNLSGIAAITAGSAHFFALTSSGEVWAWGANWSGQLGDGSTADSINPKKVRNLANIVYITAGHSHSLAISHKGYIYSWGSNDHGQLGDGTTETRYLPTRVVGIENAIQVSAGNETSMALTDDYKIYTWGTGSLGQLGNDTLLATQDIPVMIETEGKPIFISSGYSHNFYIADGNGLYTWGNNDNNVLGTGDILSRTKPTNVFDAVVSVVPIYPNPINGASTWAVPELTSLFGMDFLPPMLWSSYQSNVTRAEFAGLLISMYETMNGREISYPENTNFKDITNHVFAIEIRKAFEIELVAGVSETDYNPEGRITRQEAAKMICTFICIVEDIELPIWGYVQQYLDAADIAAWAVPFVAFAHENDIMQGSDGYFLPLNNLTREQILAMIYRTILKYNWKIYDNEAGQYA